MRGRVFFLSFSLSVLAGGASVLGALAAGCSSNESPPPPATVVGPPGPGQALGTPCDPSIADPCETLTDVCSVAVCDPSSNRCERVSVDAGPTCSGGSPPPSCSDEECDGGSDSGDATTDGTAPDAAVDGATDSALGADGADAALDAPLEAGDAGGD